MFETKIEKKINSSKLALNICEQPTNKNSKGIISAITDTVGGIYQVIHYKILKTIKI